MLASNVAPYGNDASESFPVAAPRTLHRWLFAIVIGGYLGRQHLRIGKVDRIKAGGKWELAHEGGVGRAQRPLWRNLQGDPGRRPQDTPLGVVGLDCRESGVLSIVSNSLVETSSASLDIPA